MKKALFIISLLLASCFPFAFTATDEGYGEDHLSLGQFVDSFENLNNVSVIEDLIRNATLDAIELNQTIGISYGDFNNGVEITINHSRLNLDLNLTDFPVLLNISNSAGIDDDDLTPIFDEIGSSYLKIAITNVAQDLEYYVEVEYWNSTEELGYLWVSYNVSRLENTTVRFFYDASAPNNTGYVGLSGSVVASNVWDNDFLCVLHLNQESGNFNDSTRYNNDGIEQGDGVVRGQYIIDGGIDVAGTNDYVRIEDATLDNNLPRMSVEAWVNADGYGGADKAVAGDWGANQVFLLYYDFAPNNKWRMLFRDSLGGVRDVFFGANPPIAGTLYYLGATFRQNSKVRGYQNGVLTEGDLIPGITTGTTNDKIAIGEEVDGGDKDFIGKIDEFRLSNMSRTTAYFIGSNFGGRDDLVDWTTPSGLVYVSNGYFTTDDYLNDTVCNGTTLGLMVNSTIPGNTDIQVQFSNDNATWGDWEGTPLDSNILQGGFETIDLRYLNETDVYLRFNLSTTDNTLTPRVYQARIISTIGFGGTINQTINRLNGTWERYNLTDIAVTVGVHDSGNLASTYFIDSDEWNCSEVVGIPGYQINFNATGIDPEAISLYAEIWIYYDGSNNHIIAVQFWNFTSTAWVTLGYIPDMLGYQWENHTIWGLHDPVHFLNSSGAVVGRLRHVSNGNINDDISIEQFQILAFVPTGLAVGVGPVGSGAIGLIMLILICSPIIVLVVWGLRKR